MTKPLVRIVDDDEELLRSTAFLIRMAGFDAVGFESAEAFLRDDDVRRPGCVVLDVRMDGMSGLDCLRKLRDAGRDIPVVFLSGHGDIDMALWAVKHGAADFLQKPVRTERLVESCRRLIAWHEKELGRKARESALGETWETLTPKEKEAARAMAAGLSAKRAADEWGVSEQAVKMHRSSVYRKLGVKTPVEVARWVASVEAKGAGEDETGTLVRATLLADDGDAP